MHRSRFLTRNAFLYKFFHNQKKSIKPILLIHGGAGVPGDQAGLKKINGMKKALRDSVHHLCPKDGSLGSALNAVEAAVCAMESDEVFNAGYGSCLNQTGDIEEDASIMEGKNLCAGCVTLLHDIMHPISVARSVMKLSEHTFFGGPNAQKFALQQGFEELPKGSLVTENARNELNKWLKRQNSQCNETKEGPENFGTVGAVAIESAGNIAAATSTGGMTGKLPGRIGDTPILGCGTYADNLVGGVSATGHGETIMRFNLAQKILEKIRCCKMSAQEATEEACREMTNRLKGTGGAVTIDANGRIGVYWTTKRMAWAYVQGNLLHCGIEHGKEFVETV